MISVPLFWPGVLSASQLLTLEMLVWLLQFHKQVRIERLAACFPLPILYESRRRHVQRFLALPSDGRRLGREIHIEG